MAKAAGRPLTIALMLAHTVAYGGMGVLGHRHPHAPWWLWAANLMVLSLYLAAHQSAMARHPLPGATRGDRVVPPVLNAAGAVAFAACAHWNSIGWGVVAYLGGATVLLASIYQPAKTSPPRL